MNKKKENIIMKRIIHHTKKILKHPHTKKVAWGSVALTTVLLVAEFITFDKTLDLHSGKAATTTGVLTATANVQAACTVSGNTMAFGTYTGAQIDQTGVITANCTRGTSYTVAMTTIQTGGNYVMNTTPVVDPLNYKLYTNTGRTTEIVAGTQIETNGTGNGNNQNITVYGRLPAAQLASIGAYSGTTTFTLTY
jgi:spore coat protein U-like protein